MVLKDMLNLSKRKVYLIRIEKFDRENTLKRCLYQKTKTQYTYSSCSWWKQEMGQKEKKALLVWPQERRKKDGRPVGLGFRKARNKDGNNIRSFYREPEQTWIDSYGNSKD